MKITKYFTKYTQQYEICLREHKLGNITVSRNHKIGEDIGVWDKTTINWCACGAQTIEQTEIFRGAMETALALAKVIEFELPLEGELWEVVSGNCQEH